ncbi:hypothetical protein GCM10009733_006100 [Nonomuraea maheshkhaliensis]|uniref:DUF6545 domain-containing protein n=1 Tax=Nonomuraea maheshkhaliensis TaxID=419590 RepID=A0ABP4QLS5_9ACTN
MPDWLNYAFVGVMWLIVLGRGVAMWHTRGHLMMWLALLSGISSITIDQTPPLADWITKQAGTPALAFVLVTVLALAAVTWVTTFFLAATETEKDSRWSRRPWYSWYFTIPVMIALTIIAFSGRLDMHSAYTAVWQHSATPQQLAMIVLYELHLLFNLALMTYLFIKLARRENIPYMRLALRILAATSVGSGSRGVYTLATIVAPRPFWPETTAIVLDLNIISYLLGFISITVLGVVGLAQHRTVRRQLKALLPLQTALRSAGLGHPSRLTEDNMPLRQALIARYTQIEDGLWRLRPYGTQDDVARAHLYMRSQWILGRRRREAIAMAAWISLMLHRQEQGITPAPIDKDASTAAQGTWVGSATTAAKPFIMLAPFFVIIRRTWGRVWARLLILLRKKPSYINRDITRMARVSAAFERHPQVAKFVETYAKSAKQSSSA